MSRGISEGKQKKKLPILLKAVEFFYSLKTKWWFNSHTKWTVRVSSSFEPSGVHANSYQHCDTRGVDGIPHPPLEFLICCSISKRFYLQWNAFDLLYKMKVYFMGGGAAGGLWRHLQWLPSWVPSWILLRIKNRLKPPKLATFCASDEK